jgi:hypothetical protein
LFVPLADATAAPALDIRTELGIGGWVVPGTFTPLRVDLSAPDHVEGILEVEVPALGGDPPLQHVHAVRVTPGARQQIAFDVIISDPRRPLTLRVRSGRTLLAHREIPLGVQRTAEGVVAALTREAAGLEFLSDSSRKIRPAYLREDELPLRWQSYGAVELVALRDIDSRALRPAQQQALIDWVAQGGRLLVSAHDGGVIPEWLQPLLPARIETARFSPAPGIPVRLAGLDPLGGGLVVRRAGDAPVAVRGRYGRGIVEVWAFDAFAPSARAWPGRLVLWHSLLAAPRILPLAHEALAAELPQTRALPGSTQAVLAFLSVLYILVLRSVVRRLGGRRGGWIGILATIALFAVALFTLASGARAGATALAQISIVESLPAARSARVTTYASLITPYGGDFVIRLPEGAGIRRLEPSALRIIETDRAVLGSATSGHLMLEATQMIAFNLPVEARASGGVLHLVVGRSSSVPVRDAVLYRGRQLYRLSEGLTPGQIRVDPARWERIDRPGVLGGETGGRALEWMFGQLDRAPGADLWLLGRVDDDRLQIRLARGGTWPATQLLVIPVVVR